MKLQLTIMLKAWRTETRRRRLNEMYNCLKNFNFEKGKKRLREVHTIAPAELNKYLAEFIRSVRRKSGDYEPSSLRCLVSSLERAFEEKMTIP